MFSDLFLLSNTILSVVSAAVFDCAELYVVLALGNSVYGCLCSCCSFFLCDLTGQYPSCLLECFEGYLFSITPVVVIANPMFSHVCSSNSFFDDAKRGKMG